MVIRPRTVAPSANSPSSVTPNHAPNWCASLMARHTRARGARSTTCFSIRSVLLRLVVIGNLLVADHTAPAAQYATFRLRKSGRSGRLSGGDRGGLVSGVGIRRGGEVAQPVDARRQHR